LFVYEADTIRMQLCNVNWHTCRFRYDNHIDFKVNKIIAMKRKKTLTEKTRQIKHVKTRVWVVPFI